MSKADEKAKKGTSVRQVVSRALLASCFAYFSTLKMEATCSSETSVVDRTINKEVTRLITGVQ
jgi:hypothetical protein